MPGAARAVRLGTGTHGTCTRGTSSPNGQIALGTVHVGGGEEHSFTLYPSDGSAEQGTISGIASTLVADLDPWFHWTSVGWTGLWRQDSAGAPSLGSFDASGARIATTGYVVVATAPDAHGGSVVIAQDAPSGAPPTARLEWLDGRGSVVRTAPLDERPAMLLVNWLTGHVLTLVRPLDGGVLRARWHDDRGTPLTPWFVAGAPLERPTMHLLLDGTIALGDVDGWRGVFRDGVAAIAPPPGWLAARPGTRLASIRGGRGYAVLPYRHGASPGPPGAAASTFEILAASGDSCGTVTIPAAPAEAGVTRAPTGLEVGQDGTLIALDSLGGDPLGFGIHCEFRWWPALLR